MKKLESILTLAHKLHDQSLVEAFADNIEIVNASSSKSLSFQIKYSINLYFHDCSSDLRVLSAHLVRWVKINEKNKPAGLIFESEYFAKDTRTFEYGFKIDVSEEISVIEEKGELIIDACEI